MSDHNDAIEMFVGITNAEREVAEHYLAAHAWDLNLAVEFYLENPPDTRAAAAVGAQAHADPQAGFASDERGPDLAVHGSTFPNSRPFPSFRPPAPAPGTANTRPAVYDVDDDGSDDDLQAALQASLAAPHSPEVDMTDLADDEDELQSLNRQRQIVRDARRRQEQQSEELLGSTTRSANIIPSFRPAPQQATGPPPRRRHQPPRASAAAPSTSHPVPAYTPPTVYPAPGPAAAHGGYHPIHEGPDSDVEVVEDPHGIPDLPDGINIEEARMLEAAMLGVPYTGRIPSFSDRPPQPPPSPGAVAARYLRQEQDDAYEESLRADRAKAAADAAAKRESEEAEERARREAEDEKRRLREEEDARVQAAAEAERQLARSLTLKAQRVPEEPAAEDADAVMLMVRMPDGGRSSRRFRRGDLLQAVFDHLDVQGKGQEGAPQPGSYNLVTQFPRRVFSEGSPGTLQEAGLTARQEALFLELAAGSSS